MRILRLHLAILLLATSCATGPAPRVPVAGNLERIVDEGLAGPIANGRFSGAILVEKDGHTLLRKAYGLADRNAGSPNTPETRFMLMSVSKQFTSALILRLAAQGKLDVRDGVGKYLDHWPAEWDAVTIHDLLSHSSGLDIDTTYFWLIHHHPEYWPDPGETPPAYEPRALVTPPGTVYLYSNVGYTLLSRIAAKAGGKPFDELRRDEVFRPLGMDHTAPERGQAPFNRARGYRHTLSGFELYEQKTIDIVGAGDLVSTVDDLAKWDKALRDDRFLPASLRTAMLTPYVQGKLGGVGYGWFLREREGRLPLQMHGGHGAGFRAWNLRVPEAHLTVVLLSNTFDESSPWVLELLVKIESATEEPALSKSKP